MENIAVNLPYFLGQTAIRSESNTRPSRYLPMDILQGRTTKEIDVRLLLLLKREKSEIVTFTAPFY